MFDITSATPQTSTALLSQLPFPIFLHFETVYSWVSLSSSSEGRTKGARGCLLMGWAVGRQEVLPPSLVWPGGCGPGPGLCLLLSGSFSSALSDRKAEDSCVSVQSLPAAHSLTPLSCSSFAWPGSQLGGTMVLCCLPQNNVVWVFRNHQMGSKLRSLYSGSPQLSGDIYLTLFSHSPGKWNEGKQG